MLQEVIEKSKCVFHGIRFEVRALKEKKFVREFVAHPGAVVIIPVFDNGDIALIKNRRFAVGETLLELPAGTLEPDEEPVVTAKRELLEETGLATHSINFLFHFFTSPGISNEQIWAYVAKNLVEEKQKLDESEEIEVVRLSRKEILGLIEHNQIKDAKTIAALLYFFSFADKSP